MWFQKSISCNAYVETRRGHFENIPLSGSYKVETMLQKAYVDTKFSSWFAL